MMIGSKVRMVSCGLLAALPMLGTASTSGTDAMPADRAVEVFEQANRTFDEAAALLNEQPGRASSLLHESIAGWRTLIDEGGFHSGPLHYNIGNAYFLDDDLGRAIASYRRAARLTPNDINLVDNLTYARQRVANRIESGETARPLRVLFFWHYDTSPLVRFWVFIVTSGAAWIMAMLGMLRMLPFRARWAFAGLMAVALASLGSAVLQAANESSVTEAVIVAREVVGRMGPDASVYGPSFQSPLSAGVECIVVEERPGWVLVRLADGRETWLPRESIETI